MAKKMRLSEAVDQYLRARTARCSPTTVAQDRFVTRRFIAAVGDLYVHNLTADHVERWFLSLREPHKCRDGRTREAVQASTYNYYFARVKSSMVIDTVELTSNEVQHGQTYPHADLAVVDGIEWTRQPDGSITTSGGRLRVWSGWAPEEDSLNVRKYAYLLPPSPRE